MGPLDRNGARTDELAGDAIGAAGLRSDPGRTAAATRLVPGPGGNRAIDRLTDLAARLLGVPSAQVSLLTTEQVVAGGTGLSPGSIGASSALDDSMCSVTAESDGVLAVTDAAADPRVATLPPVVSGQVGAYLGFPLVNSVGRVVGALCAFDPESRGWSAFDVGIIEALAQSVMAELELSALSAEYELRRLRWDVASEGADIGSFEIDVRTGRMVIDERARALYGYPDDRVVVSRDDAVERIHPDDRGSVAAQYAAAVESGRDYRDEYRIARPGRPTRWVALRGRVQRDPEGRPTRLIGAVFDSTEARSARDQAAYLLETMATGFLAMDHDWRISYANARAEEILALPSDVMVGSSLWDVSPGLSDVEADGRYRRALDSGDPVEVEAYYPHLDAWFEVRAVPSADGLAVYFIDITSRRVAQEEAEAARRHAEAMRAQAEKAASRLALLATVSAELASSLEAETAVARLAELLVPSLADWCIVTLVDEAGTARDVGSWHRDLDLREVVARYAATRFDGRLRPGSHGEARAARRMVVTPSGVTETAATVIGSDEALAALRQLAPESAAVVPLITNDRVVGLVTLCRGAARLPMSDEALATAQQVADRVTIALDNARLYSDQRSLAEGLQRSLLTPPPDTDDAHIAVRYVPAAERASVGGDWFDSFLQPDGATVLVIGDVVGHDTEAAAAMGQLRGLLRGIAWSSGLGPAAVLAGLDDAMQGLAVDTTASAIVACLEQAGEHGQQGGRILRWSNAGHPPPLLLRPDGTVATLDAAAPELLLGIDPRTGRSESVLEVESGTTVLLYTDGLVERHGLSLDDGLARLARTLADLADLPLEVLCDELLSRMLPERSPDDVALVALRLRPGAGPAR